MAVIVRMTGMAVIVRACHLLLSGNSRVANGSENGVGNPDETEHFVRLRLVLVKLNSKEKFHG